ncbi:MAG: hypothetical protein ACM3ZE_04320 [Myxococcales bacterium]
MQVFVDGSQVRLPVSLQSAPDRHWTQTLASVLQYGLAPEQNALELHATQVLSVVRHTGVGAAQFALDRQETQVPAVVLQIGLSWPQSASVAHPTQTPFLTLQTGKAVGHPALQRMDPLPAPAVIAFAAPAGTAPAPAPALVAAPWLEVPEAPEVPEVPELPGSALLGLPARLRGSAYDDCPKPVMPPLPAPPANAPLAPAEDSQSPRERQSLFVSEQLTNVDVASARIASVTELLRPEDLSPKDIGKLTGVKLVVTSEGRPHPSGAWHIGSRRSPLRALLTEDESNCGGCDLASSNAWG